MRISEIYDRYRIMPTLQLHMLRVAAVGQILVENCNQPVDGVAVITAGLLHDLGNITKFNLHVFPEFIRPEGYEYWDHVKQETLETYGPNPTIATAAMCRELGVSDQVLALIKAINFSEAKTNYQSDDWSRKICAYSDMRVSPQGVTTLQARLEEARARYTKPDKTYSHHDAMRAFLALIELQLAEVVAMPLSNITESKAEERFEALRRWEV